MNTEETKPSPTPAAGDDMETRLQTLETKIEDRLGQVGRDLGKLRERLKTGAPSQPAEGPKALTHEDLAAAMEAGRLSASLPEAARARVDALVADGRYAEARGMAEFARELGVKPEGQAPKPPRAGGVSGAPSGPGAFPTSMKELVALQKSDPEAFRRIMVDPNFDHGALTS